MVERSAPRRPMRRCFAPSTGLLALRRPYSKGLSDFWILG
jgi:hypothetical protein